MYQRPTYFLENQLERLRLPGLPLGKMGSVELLHLSTPDHLRNFLESVLTEKPETGIRLASHLGAEGARSAYPSLGHLEEKHGVRVVDLPSLAAEPRPDAAVLLFSAHGRPSPTHFRSFRRRLSQSSAAFKCIIEEDGSIWPGGFPRRLRRKILRRLVAPLVPRRDGEERRLLESRLLPDPGYDPADPPPAAAPPSREKHRLLLKFPFRIEQNEETGTIVKRLGLDNAEEDRLYEENYHDAVYTAFRADWESLRRQYQRRRWRNMQKVGVGEAGDYGPAPAALDVGCGTGLFTDLLTRKGFQTLGVDRARSVVERVRKTFPHCVFETRRFESLAAETGRFGLVVLSHVLEHAQDDAAFLKSLGPLLKPEGRLYIEVPWMDVGPLRARPGWHRQRDHYREYSKRGLYQLVVGAGFEVTAHADSFEDEGREPYQFMLAKKP